MSFHSDDLEKLDETYKQVIPIMLSSKSSNMVIYENPLYDDLPLIQSNNQLFSSDDFAMLDDFINDFISNKS